MGCGIGCITKLDGGGIDIATMPCSIFGRVTSSGEERSSIEPNSFSSFSRSSSTLLGAG